MICSYLKQADRIAFWEAKNGTIPEGQRLGWSCLVAYCYKVEHMQLCENKTRNWNNWAAFIRRMKTLEVGEFFEIEKPAAADMKRFRSAMAQASGMHCYALRTSQDGKTVKIYRTGTWDEREIAVNLAVSIRVVWNPNMADISKLPPIYWFGMIGGSLGPSMHRDESKQYVSQCGFKGCPFPRHSDKFCYRHENFQLFSWIMQGRQSIDSVDIYGSEKRSPIFTLMRGYELQYSANNAKFERRGVWNRGEKMSDDWWNKHVAAAIQERTFGIQTTGPSGHKGWGKKKVRRMQRQRPAGWHGSRPAQKPVKVERESISDLPQWTPPREEEPEIALEPEVEIYFDEDEERETLIGSMEHDFDEVFCEQ